MADPIELLHQQHDMLKAQYGKLKGARDLLDHTRQEMDQLTKLGDTIIPDDVIKASGRLVGHGIGNAAMAEILATMPAQGGQPLAEWVKQHDAEVRQREQHLDQVSDQFRHHLAVTGLRVLAADHLQNPAQTQPIQSGGIAINNPLTGQSNAN